MSQQSSGRKSPVLRSPLRTAIGLGSAGTGTGHWWSQRLSAVALVPLTLWFAISLLGLPALDFATVHAWLSATLHAVFVVFLLVTLVYHSSLGLQVVAEDYIQHAGGRAVVLALLWLAHVVLAIAGVYAVVVISVGAPA